MDKSVCRFCRDGCRHMVATRERPDRAVKADPLASVNGLHCIRIFHAPIIYGRTGLPSRSWRVNGKGSSTRRGSSNRVTWRRPSTRWQNSSRSTSRARAERRRRLRLGQYTFMEGYAAPSLMKPGSLEQPRSNARLCMASAVAAFMETFGIGRTGRELRRYAHHRHGRAVGAKHGGDAPGPLVQDHQRKLTFPRGSRS